MSQDLRSYIDLIREHKLLLDIKKEVDPLTDELRHYFEPVKPQGLASVKLEDILG